MLQLVASQELYQRFPHYHEGELSKLRAHLVNAHHLVHCAQQLHLGSYLRLGRGEEKTGGRRKSALLSDAVEALLAALYLDGGLVPARAFVLSHILEPELERLSADHGRGAGGRPQIAAAGVAARQRTSGAALRNGRRRGPGASQELHHAGHRARCRQSSRVRHAGQRQHQEGGQPVGGAEGAGTAAERAGEAGAASGKHGSAPPLQTAAANGVNLPSLRR